MRVIGSAPNLQELRVGLVNDIFNRRAIAADAVVEIIRSLPSCLEKITFPFFSARNHVHSDNVRVTDVLADAVRSTLHNLRQFATNKAIASAEYDSHVAELVNALSSCCPRMTSLDLSGIYIGPLAASALAPMPNLRCIYFSMRYVPQQNVAPVIFERLGHSTVNLEVSTVNLEVLKYVNSGDESSSMGGNECASLAELVCQLHHLKELDISGHMGCGDDGIIQLMAAVAQCPSVEKLWMDGVVMGPPALKALAATVSSLPKLRSLNFSNSSFPFEMRE